MLPHPLTNFWIQKYCQNETKFNGTYSLNNLGNKIKDRVYVINLDEYADIDTNWIALCVLNNDVTYFDSFGVEHILKDIILCISSKNIVTNIFRVQVFDSIMCRFFFIGFIDHMLTGKILIIELICFHHIVLIKVKNIEKNNKNNNKKNGWII